MLYTTATFIDDTRSGVSSAQGIATIILGEEFEEEAYWGLAFLHLSCTVIVAIVGKPWYHSTFTFT